MFYKILKNSDMTESERNTDGLTHVSANGFFYDSMIYRLVVSLDPHTWEWRIEYEEYLNQSKVFDESGQGWNDLITKLFSSGIKPLDFAPFRNWEVYLSEAN